MNLRELFTAAKHMLSPTPEAELPLIRHPEIAEDDELLFWSDVRYLNDLQREILDALADGAFLWEMPIPVEGEQFWDSWGWPSDEAAVLIDEWKNEIRSAA